MKKFLIEKYQNLILYYLAEWFIDILYFFNILRLTFEKIYWYCVLGHNETLPWLFYNYPETHLKISV